MRDGNCGHTFVEPSRRTAQCPVCAACADTTMALWWCPQGNGCGLGAVTH